ncbi:phospholysine phosphohistidine inorganic pyrophosphate phosphatase-like [Bacillus rossius redtenbacheri]|uniref:phospholysine phosphohistidine inorganic pyrophosphate phosphatase-like n=1 Tax=Bacillus rossius redtenbacheri TaxID=93214 RepID=UPI002FDE48F4
MVVAISIRPVKCVLLDISGVLKNGKQAIPKSVEAFSKLRASGMPVKLVTNETQETRRALASTLKSLGFDLQENDITLPCPAAARYLKDERLRPYLLVHPNVREEFSDVDQNSPNCVVVGDAGQNFTYELLNDAFRVLLNVEKPRLFSLGRGKYYREENELVLDVGAFATALEYAAGVKAEIVGKPQKEFFVSALTDLNMTAEDAVMVGDDVLHDIGGAQNSGLQGVLVRTGKFRTGDENHPDVKPDAIVDDLAEAVELILNSNRLK